jgi:glycosyltransferase involved in cell wall biosynthesis
VRIAVVGPGHPQKGGVALHTTMLARRLAEDGHDVVHVTWASAYPAMLYPGEITVPGGPETAPLPRTRSALRWYDPLGWWQVAGEVAAADLVVLVQVAAVQVPALLMIARRCRAHGTRTVLVAHNVRSHEPRPGESAAVRALLRAVDRVVVHTDEEAARAREAGASDVRPAPLAPAYPDSVAAGAVARMSLATPPTALMLGLVRPYKGVDLAIRALASVPGLRLVVAGEFWVDPAELAELAGATGVRDRVELRPGYVDATDLPPLFAAADVVLLPYRTATGTQQAGLARAFGLPVVATRVGALAVDVRDDVDGILCDPGDVEALATAVRRALEPERWASMATAARTRAAQDPAGAWAPYLTAVLGQDR